MAQQSKDLFDDSSMSFGDHLEVLRTHLWKAVVGVALCVIVALFYGSDIIKVMRQPIDAALEEYSVRTGKKLQATEDIAKDVNMSEKIVVWWKEQWGMETDPDAANKDPLVTAEEERLDRIEVQVSAGELAAAMKELDKDYPEVHGEAAAKSVSLHLTSDVFKQLRREKPVALNVQEAFMTYLKVSMIAGFVISSPWVFWQVWQFVAAGLYRHERKFVYMYGVLSMVLFLVGVVFCFRWVFPFVLAFLLQFNSLMDIEPQIRLSEWISFAVTLPLMFGISFQLPLVMRFLQAISIVQTQTFRDKRRMAILVIAFLSMVLTPAEPMSMILMMVPLIILYEFGILLCEYAPTGNPFDAEPV